MTWRDDDGVLRTRDGQAIPEPFGVGNSGVDLLAKVAGTALLLACGASTDEIEQLETVPSIYDLPATEMVAALQAAIREYRNERGYVDMGITPGPQSPAEITAAARVHRDEHDRAEEYV